MGVLSVENVCVCAASIVLYFTIPNYFTAKSRKNKNKHYCKMVNMEVFVPWVFVIILICAFSVSYCSRSDGCNQHLGARPSSSDLSFGKQHKATVTPAPVAADLWYTFQCEVAAEYRLSVSHWLRQKENMMVKSVWCEQQEWEICSFFSFFAENPQFSLDLRQFLSAAKIPTIHIVAFLSVVCLWNRSRIDSLL